VDSTAELDQILSAQQGTAPRVRSPYSEQSSSSSSEPDTPDPTSSKPKFSDALSHLTASQKRPRSPALRPSSSSPAYTLGPARGGVSTSNQPESQHPAQSHQIVARSPYLRVSQVDAREGEPTPRPRKVHLRTQAVDSDNALRLPTPSTANSNFTRLAKGLAREIEAEQSRWHAPLEVGGAHVGTKEGRTLVSSSDVRRKQVQLPDVTGLTVAVESPAKGQSYHQPYGNTSKVNGDDEGHCLSLSPSLCPPTQNVSARLQSAMNVLQKKIAHLDAENQTSRRRMKELERELDVCRQDVERQREQVTRREDLLLKQRPEAKSKGKVRAVEDPKEEQKRYEQAVEEKKGS